MFSVNHPIKRQTGFTLLEIMVVVIIVALLMSAVVPMVSRNADDLLQEQADRFIALVKLAQDESILQSRQLGLQITKESYSFLQQEGDVWTAFAEGPFRQRSLPSGASASLYLESVDVSLSDNMTGDKKSQPQVFILSSGEMTPFSYEFVFPTGSRVKVTFDAIGNYTKVLTKKE